MCVKRVAVNDELQAQSPFSPVFLPEFNSHVSWFMCRNPACQNFGHHFQPDSSQPVSQRTFSDARYRIDTKVAKIYCRSCQMSFGLKSNLSIRAIARYFLSLSLPFADCPNDNCENHGQNLFEHCPPSTKGRRSRNDPRPYFRAGEHRVECRVCGGKFTFGSPHLKARDETKGAKVITGIFEQRKVSRNVEIQGMSATSYYSHLHRFAESFRDWQSVQTAQLLRKEYAEWQAPLRIYTDEIQVSLQRAGDGPRYQLLNIVVTVAAAERRYFVLAAHPAFLPEKPRDPPLDVLLQNESLPIHVRQWDALHHSFASGPTQSAEKMLHALPNLGCGGHFLTSPYVELAHFLVVAKLLSRFPKVHMYMDGSRHLFAAALTAFREGVQSGRVEIGLFQHDKAYQGDRKNRIGYNARSKSEQTPDSSWKGFEKAFAKQLKKKMKKMRKRAKADARKPGVIPDESVIAGVFKSALRGGYSEVGKWAWLKYPPSTKQYRNARTLWLTWNPDKDYQSVGRAVYAHATLQPVDSAFAAFRKRARGMKRVAGRAAGGRSYSEAYVMPTNVMAELWIALFAFNYLTIGREDKIPRATLLNLAPEGGTQPIAENVALQFRLNVAHAERMTRWASR